jgi:pilus assembly protein CpaB
MKMKSLVLLIVALGCGLVAMLGVQQVMSGPKAPDDSQTDTKKVLVAAKDIAPFSLVDESNTEFKEVPASMVPEGAITSRSEYVDTRLRYFVAKGDLIQLSKLTSKNYAPSQEIPKHMRVVTVKVNATKTHSGLIRPNDHVDVVLTYKTGRPGGPTRQRTVTVLRNVVVFSIDDKRQTNSADDTNELKAKNISLLVTPKHGNLLMLAENRGMLTLALRRGGEKEKPEKDQARDYSSFDDTVFDNMDRPKDGSQRTNGARSKTGMGAFEQFLAGAKNGQTKGDKPDKGQKSKDAATVKPKWKITIYEGRNPRIEEIELPDANDRKNKSSNDG